MAVSQLVDAIHLGDYATAGTLLEKRYPRARRLFPAVLGRFGTAESISGPTPRDECGGRLLIFENASWVPGWDYLIVQDTVLSDIGYQPFKTVMNVRPHLPISGSHVLYYRPAAVEIDALGRAI